MPTDAQLNNNWAANHVLFGGNTGVTGREPCDEIANNLQGETFGTIEFDPKTQELTMILNDDATKNDPSSL